MGKRRWSLGWGLLYSALFASAWADEACDPGVGQVVSVQGQVVISRSGSPQWMPATLRGTLCPGDRIRIEARSRAAIHLVDDTVLRLDQGTTVTFSKSEPDAPSWIELLRGAVHFLSRVPQRLTIHTPYVNAGVEGTEFVVQVVPGETRVYVLAGQVLTSNAAGSLRLTSGEAAVSVVGQPPQRLIVVKPRDAVQWALYYPPLVDSRRRVYPTGPDTEAIHAALASYRAGDLPAAFDALEAVPTTGRDARYETLKAGLLLTVGRVDEARSAIARALVKDPDDAHAPALEAVIAVAQGDKDTALERAQTAIRRDPDSPLAYIALSYAYQARFQIEQARQSVEEALQRDADNALAWARLAELWLASGYHQRALDAAQNAARLDPTLERTQTVLGFAYLAETEVDQAFAAFQQAIDFDPAAPLPRLGLGLAQIRTGKLDEGIRDIEIAAMLDPDNALIRSYLGKAYYEQKRDRLAATEFANAKALDPNDPTPWFYDAIRKQTINRPVQALRNMQRAIALNDNRAVYRSRLLLDQDQAARGASLARLYDDLGFQQAALVEATKSLSSDPANPSAHRFLSDTYALLPRHEIAQLSELLQAQLLQPINVNPVQPQLAVIVPDIISTAGPSTASFNEFTRLFETNRPQLLASGLVGNRSTLGGEAVTSGLYQRLSYSLGAVHTETDGFRENNDLLQTAYNAFLQLEVTPKLNLQGEFRQRDSQHGDLSLNFDPEAFFADDRRKLTQTTARAGVRFSPAPHSNLILSLIHNESDDKNNFILFNREFEFLSEARGYQIQAQYLFHSEHYNLVAGTSFYRIDIDEDLASFKSSFTEDQDTAYLYGNVHWPSDFTWTIGLGYDRYEERQSKLVDQLSPKLGVQWQPTENLRLRAAAIRTAKPALVANQTIEPTQVAGFNQFFDDANGTRADRYGLGLDARLLDSLYAGAEASRRKLQTPFFIPPLREFEFQDWREALVRAYLYWMPHDDWAVSSEFRFDGFKLATTETVFPLPPNIPTRVETLSIPVVARYFNENGLFATLGTRYVHQTVDLSPASTFQQNGDDFFLLDASVGYRFPKRWGVLSLEGRNLLDKRFLFQDDSFRSSVTRMPPIVPARTLLARLTVNWD